MATEEPVVPVESAAEPTNAEPAEENPANKAAKSKKSKQPKEKKPAAARKTRNPPTHPPYEEMIKDAIVTLKERTGSSQYAITKFIEEKQKQLPSNFKKLLLFHLKKLVASGKLVKVKSSFKLKSAKSAIVKPASPAKKLAAAKPKPKAAAKTKAVAKSSAKPKAAAKPKPKTAAKPKAAAKPKPTAAKSKSSVVAKPKAASKTKAAPKPKAKEKPAKASRTSTRTSPGKKAPAPKPAVKKAPAKSATAKKVKSPARKSPARRAKNDFNGQCDFVDYLETFGFSCARNGYGLRNRSLALLLSLDIIRLRFCYCCTSVTRSFIVWYVSNKLFVQMNRCRLQMVKSLVHKMPCNLKIGLNGFLSFWKHSD
ncbi:Histone H1.2, partial [Cucurbita argyrosperma subsp. sororia]